MYDKSFILNGRKLWNALPKEIKVRNFDKFKSHFRPTSSKQKLSKMIINDIPLVLCNLLKMMTTTLPSFFKIYLSVYLIFCVLLQIS